MWIGPFLTASQSTKKLSHRYGYSKKRIWSRTSQGSNNGEGESRGIWKVSMCRLWMSQSFFSLGFLSQYSLWKLSIFCGYEGYLYLCVFGMRRVSFSKTELAGGLASRLDWAMSSSRELTEWLVWTFCPVVLQLAWRFNFSACLARV